MEPCFGNTFRLGWKIADTSFGEIYHGTEIETDEEVAIKLENVETKNPQLILKSQVYTLLQGGTGIPNMRWYGVEENNNVLVMDLLGRSLKELFEHCGRKFSLKTVLMLADQMISCVEFVHSKSYLHCNIKPENFHMGLRSQATQVSLIGFGLQSKMYIDSSTDQHIPYRKNNTFTGSTSYASVKTHLGTEQSRKDDMESLGYILMYFVRGSLPWKGLRTRIKEEKFRTKLETKIMTSNEALSRGYPIEFASYFRYCHSLTFEEKPDYDYLRRMFRDLFIREGFQFDNKFDWHVLAYRLSKMRALERMKLANAKDLQPLQPGDKSNLPKSNDFYNEENGMLEAKDISARDGLTLRSRVDPVVKVPNARPIGWWFDSLSPPPMIYQNKRKTLPPLPALPEKDEYQHEIEYIREKDKYQHGIEYIRETFRSSFVGRQIHKYINRQESKAAPYNVLGKNDYEKQGTQYIRPVVPSPSVRVQTREYEIRQGIQYIRETSKSPFMGRQIHKYKNRQESKAAPYNVLEKNDYEKQGTQYIRPVEPSPSVRVQTHEYKIQQGIQYIRETAKSPSAGRQIHKYENRQENKAAPYNVLEKNDYEKQGTQYIRPVEPSPSVRVQTHEYEIQQGTRYIRETSKSSFVGMQIHNVPKIHEYKKQGTQYIQPVVPSPSARVQTHEYEYESGQRIQPIPAAMRSFNAAKKHEYENKQDREHIREKTSSPFVRMQTQRYENGQGMENSQLTMRSPHYGPRNEQGTRHFKFWKD